MSIIAIIIIISCMHFIKDFMTTETHLVPESPAKEEEA